MTLSQKRLHYQPRIPDILKYPERIRFVPKHLKPVLKTLQPYFPKTFSQPLHQLEVAPPKQRKPLVMGVLFSGGPAPGGHNVIWGLSALENIRLIGFLDGPSGVIENRFREISPQEIASVRNQGGFELIGTGRTKIETSEQMEAVLRHCMAHKLDGLVIIGGDDSNTNAAHLAEYFLTKGSKISVIGVPKTIDGDLRSEEIEISFGFDTACKTYSELIGNLCRDALSAKKYTHFIKLMGRSASHIALECALATQPNLTLIGEEGNSLGEIVQEMVHLIRKRKAAGKEYGVILIPEGLIEFIPEIRSLIGELNRLGRDVKLLSLSSATLLQSFPEKIQKQLLMDRDPHGNVQVSKIDTEEMLLSFVKQEIPELSSQSHFLGYEGRCGFPTN
ncbi:MAG: diphosphate--fructose-6-phosphate 1-phosphotransferase, partial [Chlamydiia bacterium]|nr:diphosphate--fructose-6-phosphate 1-phosphotransferase [Chlamydiia bacterium]